jgi:hypothetical protein
MKMTEEQVREHQQKNNLPCALDPVQGAQAQAVPAIDPVDAPPSKWASGEEKKLNELVTTDLRRRGAYVIVSRTDKQPTIRRGHPDLTVMYNGKACCIELKASGGRLSDHQRECIADLQRAGVQTVVSYSFRESIDFAVNHLHLSQ